MGDLFLREVGLAAEVPEALTEDRAEVVHAPDSRDINLCRADLPGLFGPVAIGEQRSLGSPLNSRSGS